jgi:hypothetical protein
LIYYSPNSRDSIFASAVKAIFEEAEQEVLEFRSINEFQAKVFLDTMVKTYDVYYEKKVADSIAEIPGRQIKEEKIREEQIEERPHYVKEDEESGEKEYFLLYETRYRVKKDSIGQVFIATRSNLIANNFISMVDIRGDSIKLYGYGDWFSFKVSNYTQFERLGVKLAYPEYMNEEKPGFDLLKQEFQDTFLSPPSEYHYYGYDLIYYVGKMMSRYGRYFQNGFYREGFFPGKFIEGIDFQGANENQVVPIVTLEDLRIKVINRTDYANSGE